MTTRIIARTRMLAAGALVAAAFLSFGAAAATPAGALDPVTVTAAKTRADHEALAAAYEAEAVAAEQKAQMHRDMGTAYGQITAGGKPPWNQMASHCVQLTKQYAEAAKLNRELAAEHRKIAATLK